MTNTMNDKRTIHGCTVEHDASGVGHAWRVVSGDDLTPDVHEALAAEIQETIADDQDLGDAVIGGEKYRWTRC